MEEDEFEKWKNDFEKKLIESQTNALVLFFKRGFKRGIVAGAIATNIAYVVFYLIFIK